MEVTEFPALELKGHSPTPLLQSLSPWLLSHLSRWGPWIPLSASLMSWRSLISLLKGKIFLIYYIQVRMCQCCQKTQCFCFGWPWTSQEEPGGSSWGCRRPWGDLLAQAACFFRGLSFRGLWNKVLKHLEKYNAAFEAQRIKYAIKDFHVGKKAVLWLDKVKSRLSTCATQQTYLPSPNIQLHGLAGWGSLATTWFPFCSRYIQVLKDRFNFFKKKWD